MSFPLRFPSMLALLGLAPIIAMLQSVPSAHAEDGAAVAEAADQTTATPLTTAPSGIKVTLDKGGLKAESADKQFKFKIGGRLHADGTLHLGDTPSDLPPVPPATDPKNLDPTDGAEIRRARLIAKATVYEDWNWVGEVDFADNDAVVKDFFVSYTGIDDVTIAVGNQKQPYSLSLEMSSNDIPFTERSIDNEQNILLDRAIGVRVDANGDKWRVNAHQFFAHRFPQPKILEFTIAWRKRRVAAGISGHLIPAKQRPHGVFLLSGRHIGFGQLGADAVSIARRRTCIGHFVDVLKDGNGQVFESFGCRENLRDLSPKWALHFALGTGQ